LTAGTIPWPNVQPPAVAVISALHARLERTQWFTTPELESLQHIQLVTTARWFESRSASFRQRLHDAGLRAADLGDPVAFAALGVLDREQVQSLGERLFVDPPDRHRPVHEASSSGSTGRRVTIRKTAVTSTFFNALTVRDYLSRRVDLAWRLAVVRVCEPEDRADWGPPLSLLHETGPMRLVRIDEPVDVVSRAVAEFRPQFVLSYATMAAELLAAGALAGVRCVQTISEAVPDGLAEALRSKGIEVWDLYSCQEAGLLAGECPDRRGTYHVVAENVIVEVLDDDGRPAPPGAVGRVVITDLHNLATPLIRYALGDLAVAGDGPCPCGRGLPTLGRVLGRERNILVNRNGERRWPAMRKLELRAHGVRQVQLVQREPGVVVARVVTEADLGDEARAAIIQELRVRVGDDVDYVVEPIDEIARSAAGKFEEFRSELPPR
jgi:phenylacetate-CoA ligase